MKRNFSPTERKALAQAFDLHCAECGVLAENGHADHIVPHAHGGATTLANGQWLCANCNQSKGARHSAPRPLFLTAKPRRDPTAFRDWQNRACKFTLKRYAAGKPTTFIGAGVGAGKTKMAYAAYLDGDFDLIIAVVPKRGIRQSWADDAADLGLKMEQIVDGGRFMPSAKLPHGYVLTAAMLGSVAKDLALLCQKLRVLVAFDEAHHLAEDEDNKSGWAAAALVAFEHAAHRLPLSGTPARGDNLRVIGLPYFAGTEGERVGKPDFVFSYGDALASGLVAPVTMQFFDGAVGERQKSGIRMVHDYADGDYGYMAAKAAEKAMSRRLSATAVECFDWQMAAIRAARVELLRHTKALGTPCGGLIVCHRVEQAEEIARRIEAETGDRVMLIVSDADTETSVRRFRSDKSYDWAVSITKVSEGISIDRLTVGVYLTSKTWEVFAEQVRGRLARLVPGHPPAKQTATLFMPADPRLMDYATRTHSLMVHAIPALAKTTPALAKALQRKLTASTAQLTISLGRFDLVAAPKLAGGVVTDTVLPQDAFEKEREALAHVILPTHPFAASRLWRAGSEKGNSPMFEIPRLYQETRDLIDELLEIPEPRCQTPNTRWPSTW